MRETKVMKRVRQLLDQGYKFAQAYAIAKKEERAGTIKKRLQKKAV